MPENKKTCNKCYYYELDYGFWTATGWSQGGSRGQCFSEPKGVSVDGARAACRHYIERHYIEKQK